MEPTRFETLVRSVAAASSRRGLMRAASGAALIGWLGRLTIGGASAKTKKRKANKSKKKGCKAGAKKCGNTCIPKSSCCADKECDRCAREICLNGACGCNPDFIRSNGVCGKFTNCKSVGELTTDAFDCCSGESVIDADSGQERCLPGTFLCLTDFDCVSGPCRGFMCPEQYKANVGEGC